MHKSATKCNKTVGKWCKNKHGASKIIDTLETYQWRTFQRGRYESEEQGDAQKTQRRWSEHIAGRAVRGGDCARRRLTGDGEEDHGAGNRGPSESIPSAARRGSTS
jgi:hypothetical protein